MDPLCHTLCGAALAETGLRRSTPLATATLLLGANAPDVDAATFFWGRDLALGFRRGWTHGLPAMLVWPFLLAGVVWAWDRWVRRRARPDAPPVRPLRLLGLAGLAVASHPILDWLNTYGIRLLMPFDGTWFHGDALFIVDPWVWLLLAAPVVLARSRTTPARVAWVGLGALTTALVLGSGRVPVVGRIVWVVGLLGIAAARLVGPGEATRRWTARAALGLLVLYGLGMLGASHLARERSRAWLGEREVRPERLVASPVAGDPFAREVIVVEPDTYRVLRLAWPLGRPVPAGPPVPRTTPGPVVRAALDAPCVAGMRRWLRLPWWDVREADDGWQVIIRDLRYARPGERGFGSAEVEVSPSEVDEVPSPGM